VGGLASMTASTVIALSALAFTIASFWWLQARRGRLTSFEPQAYACYVQPSGFRPRLPLTIFNTGARTIVVTDLRARFDDVGRTAPVITFRRSLKPGPDDVADFAHPFPVPGRSATSHFVEFGSDDWTPPLGNRWAVRVDVQTGGHDWAQLVTVELTPPPAEKAGAYIAHRRSPAQDKADAEN